MVEGGEECRWEVRMRLVKNGKWQRAGGCVEEERNGMEVGWGWREILAEGEVKSSDEWDVAKEGMVEVVREVVPEMWYW